MRIRSLRVEGVPGLAKVDVRPLDGLVGWVGGDARHRRTLMEVFLWSLGLAGREGGGHRAWDGEEGTPAGELSLQVRGRTVALRDRGLVVEGGEEGIRHPAELLSLTPEEVGLVWAGSPELEVGLLTEESARILAGVRGLVRLERGIGRLEGLATAGSEGRAGDGERRPDGDLEPRERARLEAELAELRDQIRRLQDVPERLRSLEEELRSLRADATEVTGDLEVATMEWLRERQDAETNLQAYRDQARELRARIRQVEEAGAETPCPFCGRTLGDHHEAVLAELRDEWERLVQDGKWWRQRREQLELKPDHLQELEGRSVRLQAAVEECAERLERCRLDLRELDELRKRRREVLVALGAPPGRAEPVEPEAAEAGGEERRRRLLHAFEATRRDLLDEARKRLLRRAGTYLNRISGGRTLGLIRLDRGGPVPLEDGRAVPLSTDEDRSAFRIALRLALATLLVDDGVGLESLLIDEPFGRLDPAARLRTVELLRALADRIPQVLLVARGEAAEAAPERFDQIYEFRQEREGTAATLRALPGGVGTLRIV